MTSMENQLIKNSEEDEEEFMFAMQLATSSVLAMVMRAAIELDLLEIIVRAGPSAHLSPKEIASRLPSKNPEAPNMLDRILRLLVSHNVLTCYVVTRSTDQVERLYGLAPVCKYLVDNKDGVSISPMLILGQEKAFMDSWFHLKSSVLDGGIPFNKVHGVHIFEYLDIDPMFNHVLNRAMFDVTTIIMKKILETYIGFEGINVVVDVGGGLGTSLSVITSKYPKVKGINFDLPHVIQHASSYPGVEHVGGDMFVSVPKGEAIFMKWILHDWSNEHCLTLLKNCYKAIPDNGKVIVVEGILPVVSETNVAAKFLCQHDLIMLAQSPEGKERKGLRKRSRPWRMELDLPVSRRRAVFITTGSSSSIKISKISCQWGSFKSK